MMSNKTNIVGFEKEFANEFKKQLLQQYSEKNVIPECKLGNFRTDFAIIKEDTKEIIAIFELKMSKADSFNQQQLSGFNSRIKQLIQTNGMDVPVYYVLKSNEDQVPFTVNRLFQEEDDEHKSKFTFKETDLPTYEDLLRRNSTAENYENKKSLREAFNRLKFISPILALIIFAIWLICKICKIELTWIDLAFLLTSSIFAVFPFVKRIDITQLGSVEFRSDEQSSKEK
ncbi:hypothetical protein FFV08_05345 [Streptococcus sanguinis]|uniref:Type I restriction enzyme R protein N-terminal domain-containing protein n=1 Tax=Streptococcus sanguinis TaxID=1305 RepID=A0A7H8V6D4_STRSA|nr:hypothetical protein FFV08_05345 [Streptococcus sanguinis]